MESTISERTKEIYFYLFLNNIGPKKLKRALLTGDIESFAKFDDQQFLQAKIEAVRQIQIAEEQGYRIISFLDEDYPCDLRNSDHDPVVLYVKGKLQPRLPCIAVIGTRRPTDDGKKIGERITKELVRRNFGIVSGLAIGCDSIAHKTCIANQGYTVAVLGHGFQTIYPKENIALYEEIIQNGGAIVTQFKYDTLPMAYTFAQRDKVQAGLSKAVVLVQSGEVGGSLIASRAILDDKRKLIVPSQSKNDIDNNEEIIRANLILQQTAQTANLLRLLRKKETDYIIPNIIPLKSKKDYDKVFGILKKTN